MLLSLRRVQIPLDTLPSLPYTPPCRLTIGWDLLNGPEERGLLMCQQPLLHLGPRVSGKEKMVHWLVILWLICVPLNIWAAIWVHRRDERLSLLRVGYDLWDSEEWRRDRREALLETIFTGLCLSLAGPLGLITTIGIFSFFVTSWRFRRSEREAQVILKSKRAA